MTAFGEAFKAARSAGKTTFKFQGRQYHTKTKEEMERTKKSVPTPTPRPAQNSGPRSSSVDAENANRGSSPKSPQVTSERSSVPLAITPAKTGSTSQLASPAAERRQSAGKSSFLVNRKIEPFKFPISKPRRTRAWADK